MEDKEYTRVEKETINTHLPFVLYERNTHRSTTEGDNVLIQVVGQTAIEAYGIFKQVLKDVNENK